MYADEGKSASKSLEKRTELMRLLEDAKDGKFSVILFKDITRWSRNAAAYYKVQEVLDSCKVGWVAVEQPYLETLSPTGRFQVSIMLGTEDQVRSGCRDQARAFSVPSAQRPDRVQDRETGGRELSRHRRSHGTDHPQDLRNLQKNVQPPEML